MKQDTLKIAIDTANFIQQNIPYIMQQISVLKPLILGLVFLLLTDFLTGIRKS